MRTLIRCGCTVIALLVACLSPSLSQAKEETVKSGTEVKETKKTKKEESTLANANKAIKEITALAKRKIPPPLFKEASAVIIVPRASKQAFMVKGGNTSGMLLVRDKTGSWSSPVFITISGGTLGWQIVGDPMDIVLLLRNNKQVDALLKGKVTLDAKVTIVSGRVAATMKGASKEELSSEITSYVRSHGVFAEDSVVAGTTLQLDAAANDSFYGRPKTDAAEIVSGKLVKSTDELTSLHKLLSEYAAAK